MGNLRSVEKAFEKIGSEVAISNNHEVIRQADKIVLPGVGAFKDGMRHLEELDLIDILNDEVLHKKKPFLGICLGMHLIGTKSYEMGETRGLGWIDAEIVKFDFQNKKAKLKIPHVGWNNVSIENRSDLYKNIQSERDFYFVHSYYFRTDKKYILTTTDYGCQFVSSVQKENIFACQFHPEKSQNNGLSLLKNFINVERV